ncbi:MAG: nucleolar RNA-binding Nop10p family protein [Nitrososphaeraceae archaeon]
MKHILRKCIACNRYSIKIQCPLCSNPTIDPNPAKFSPDDKYLKYRVSAYHSEN